MDRVWGFRKYTLYPNSCYGLIPATIANNVRFIVFFHEFTGCATVYGCATVVLWLCYRKLPTDAKTNPYSRGGLPAAVCPVSHGSFSHALFLLLAP